MRSLGLADTSDEPAGFSKSAVIELTGIRKRPSSCTRLVLVQDERTVDSCSLPCMSRLRLRIASDNTDVLMASDVKAAYPEIMAATIAQHALETGTKRMRSEDVFHG